VNAWPDGQRRALTQDQHETWNASHYPGTRQMCVQCDEPTGFCEEDGYRNDDGEPLCEDCAEEQANG